MMTHRERIMAAIAGQDVDRVPFSMWYHLPQFDQDPVALAEESYRLAKLYDVDFIKMCPFGNYEAADFGLSCHYYCTPSQPVFERKFAIERVEEWGELEARRGDYAQHGKSLQFSAALKKILRAKGEDIPYVQTIFSPLTNAKKLAGERIFSDLRSHPELVHRALRAITDTTLDFCRLNIAEGVSGFFFASQCSSYDFMSEEEYQRFGVPYDLEILAAIREQTDFNIVHIHGENTMWELLAQYPVQCLNWHDRWVAPSLREAREKSDKCLMGGLNENFINHATPDEVMAHIQEAIRDAGRKRLIITPGCVACLDTPIENFFAARLAVEGQ